MKKNYYLSIEQYYDEDAGDFDARYWKNPVLQRIRQDFREQVKKHAFSNMLEIGYGTGLDMIHFAMTHPEVQVSGIDISGEMCRLTNEKIKQLQLNNVHAEKGVVEDIERLFQGQQFDMVYVFFGALNTVDDLKLVADCLYRITSKSGVLVLSFVNKYYLKGMVIELLKLRFKSAFSRLRTDWGGYSPTKYLSSKCFGIGEIKKSFSGFKLIDNKGYSIVHPAWYYHGLNRLIGRGRPSLWKIDRLLNKTPLWRFGEYTLFVFQKPDHPIK
jgi:ubiquinone/menaquinone biosynthesis C-methylase UbiE